MAGEKDSSIVETTIDAPLDTVLKCWTTPDDIVQWYNASDDWFTPSADNDLTEGGGTSLPPSVMSRSLFSALFFAKLHL